MTLDDDLDEGSIIGERDFRCDDSDVCADARQEIDDEQEFTATFEYDDDIDDRLILREVS